MPSTDSFTLAQARKILKVSDKTLRNYCKSGKINFHQVRNERGVLEYRFTERDLENFKNNARKRVKIVRSQEEKQPHDTPLHSTIASNNHDNITSKTHRTPAPGRQDHLISQLQEENAFLKELLMEKERQLAAKDRQIEKQLERISAMNETLASLAQNMLKQ